MQSDSFFFVCLFNLIKNLIKCQTSLKIIVNFLLEEQVTPLSCCSEKIMNGKTVSKLDPLVKHTKM